MKERELWGDRDHEAVFADALLHQCDVVIFDIETTGFGRETQIVEIAAIRLESGEPTAEWHSLIRPSVPISYAASRVHLIDDRMVKEAPSFAEIAPSLMHFLRDAVWMGHNIFTFDIPILQRHLRDILGGSPRLWAVDTLPLARRLFPLESHKLTLLAEHLSIPLIAHHAMSDVYATAELWLESTRRLAKRGIHRLGDLEHYRAWRHLPGLPLPSFSHAPQARLLPR